MMGDETMVCEHCFRTRKSNGRVEIKRHCYLCGYDSDVSTADLIAELRARGYITISHEDPAVVNFMKKAMRSADRFGPDPFVLAKSSTHDAAMNLALVVCRELIDKEEW